MRAIHYTEYGGPDRLNAADVAEPHAGPGQVRIAVRAAGVNPVDWKLLSGAMAGGDAPDAPTIPGIDAAGVVDEVGADVTGVAVGDEVFGFAAGAAAELAVLGDWAPKPAGVAWDEVGGFPVAVETAIRCLHLIGAAPGQTIVVDGAAGGVGQAAIQIASARGIAAIGTASEGNHDRLRELGATPTTYGDGLVDRVRALAPGGVDGAIDTAGKGSVGELAELTGAGERVVTIADFSTSVPGVHVTSGGEIDRTAALREAAALAADGKLSLPVQRTFPLEEIADAYALSLEGHVAGKLVLVP